jgi:RNA polymerase sigma-70 factor (ECF subfamily)
MLDAATVRLALLRLRRELQQVIIEIYYRGRTVGQTAELLGIPEQTARLLVYDALRALRSALDASESHEART